MIRKLNNIYLPVNIKINGDETGKLLIVTGHRSLFAALQDYGKKKLVKNIELFLKKRNKKSDNIVVNDTKISQKMKNKSLLSIENKILQNEKKRLIIITKNTILTSNDLESLFDKK